METEPDAAAAAAALTSVAASRASLADRILTPWWYHPLLGLLVGSLLAVQGVPWPAVRWAFYPFYGIGLGLLVSAYRARTGLSVNGMRSRSGRPWAIALAVTILGLWGGSSALAGGWGWTAAPFVAGALGVVAVLVLGRRYDDAIRADLRNEPGSSVRAPR